MNKYERLVEYIINDETDKARELFHQIVVEKSRDIYESLVAEEDLDETMGGNEVEDLVDEVTQDEEGLAEEEDEDMEMSFDSEEEDEDGGDHHDDVGGDEELEDRVMDLEAALDELKAEFDSLMADEGGDMGDMGDDEGSEMDDMVGADDEDAMRMMEAEEDEEDEEDEEEVDESIVREYVEKVGQPAMGSEGHEVAHGGSANVNKQSIVAKKNDMGGHNVDVTKGGTANQDGNRPASHPKPKGDLVSNPQNKPGANAGKTAFKHKESAKGSEGTTVGHGKSVPVNDTSVIKTTVR